MAIRAMIFWDFIARCVILIWFTKALHQIKASSSIVFSFLCYEFEESHSMASGTRLCFLAYAHRALYWQHALLDKQQEVRNISLLAYSYLRTNRIVEIRRSSLAWLVFIDFQNLRIKRFSSEKYCYETHFSYSTARRPWLALLHIHREIDLDVHEVIDRFAIRHPRRMKLINFLDSDRLNEICFSMR